MRCARHHDLDLDATVLQQTHDFRRDTMAHESHDAANNPLAQALKAVAGSMVRGIGTKIFYVTTGGYDTHATQNTNAANYLAADWTKAVS